MGLFNIHFTARGLLWPAMLAATIIIVLSTGGHLATHYQQALRDAEVASENTALLLEAHAVRSLDASLLLLDRLVERVEGARAVVDRERLHGMGRVAGAVPDQVSDIRAQVAAGGGMDMELRVPCRHRSVERRATAKKAAVGRQGLNFCQRLSEDA